MASLKISICFWYLDPLAVNDVVKTLGEGEIDATYFQCTERLELNTRLRENPPDLIIADFDISVKLREIVEKELEAYYADVPMIFLVGDVTKLHDHGILKTGLWRRRK